MSDKKLEEKKKKIEAEFEKVKGERQVLIDRVNALGETMLRLQGEYKAIDELLKELSK